MSDETASTKADIQSGTVSTKADIQSGPDGVQAALNRIFKELTEIRVVTMVGDVKVSVRSAENGGSISTEVDSVLGAETYVLLTVFDLIDGDVTNVISPALRDDAALRAFHSEQVERSIKVLPEHVRSLIALGKEIF